MDYKYYFEKKTQKRVLLRQDSIV